LGQLVSEKRHSSVTGVDNPSTFPVGYFLAVLQFAVLEHALERGGKLHFAGAGVAENSARLEHLLALPRVTFVTRIQWKS
jgi:hypothetical protein